MSRLNLSAVVHPYYNGGALTNHHGHHPVIKSLHPVATSGQVMKHVQDIIGSCGGSEYDAGDWKSTVHHTEPSSDITKIATWYGTLTDGEILAMEKPILDLIAQRPHAADNAANSTVSPGQRLHEVTETAVQNRIVAKMRESNVDENIVREVEGRGGGTAFVHSEEGQRIVQHAVYVIKDHWKRVGQKIRTDQIALLTKKFFQNEDIQEGLGEDVDRILKPLDASHAEKDRFVRRLEQDIEPTVKAYVRSAVPRFERLWNEVPAIEITSSLDTPSSSKLDRKDHFIELAGITLADQIIGNISRPVLTGSNEDWKLVVKKFIRGDTEYINAQDVDD